MDDCVFCKIVNKEIPTDLIYEDEDFLVFNDIQPKADVHMLVIPRVHIPSVRDQKDINPELIGNLIALGKKIAASKALEDYRLHLNNGKYAEVPHLHLHVMS